jgi:hypothetical protein
MKGKKVISQRAGRGVAASLVGLATAAAVVVPAAAPATAAPSGRCVLVAQQPDERTRTIPLTEVCGAAATAQVAAADVVTLARYYEHAGWGGINQDVVGAYGTCDREGYTFGLSAWWSDNLSSYRVYGSCYYSTVTNSWGTTRYGAIGDQDYVGDSWNDDVVRFRTWAR